MMAINQLIDEFLPSENAKVWNSIIFLASIRRLRTKK